MFELSAGIIIATVLLALFLSLCSAIGARASRGAHRPRARTPLRVSARIGPASASQPGVSTARG